MITAPNVVQKENWPDKLGKPMSSSLYVND